MNFNRGRPQNWLDSNAHVNDVHQRTQIHLDPSLNGAQHQLDNPNLPLVDYRWFCQMLTGMCASSFPAKLLHDECRERRIASKSRSKGSQGAVRVRMS